MPVSQSSSQTADDSARRRSAAARKSPAVSGSSWPALGLLGLWAVFFSAIIALAAVLNFDSAARETPGLPFPWEHLWFPGIVFALGLCGVVAGPEALYGIYGEVYKADHAGESGESGGSDAAGPAAGPIREDRDKGAAS